MTKREIPGLKNQNLLAIALTNAKDKSAVSFWWLAVPVFIILMLVIKSIVMPGVNLLSELNMLEEKNYNISLIFFLISPFAFTIFNFLSIRKIYFLSGSPKSLGFLKAAWLNVVIILFCLVIMLIYTL